VNVFDISLLLLLALFSAIGMWRGFVREFVSLVTWVTACVAAWRLSGVFAPALESMTQEGPLRQLLAFVIVFIVVFLIGTIVGVVLHKFVSRTAGLRAINRATGAVVGLARGAAIVVMLFLLAGVTSFPQRPWWRDALLSPPFERAAVFATRYLPVDVARHVRYG
jgi:membrane protein required for colicin V production